MMLGGSSAFTSFVFSIQSFGNSPWLGQAAPITHGSTAGLLWNPMRPDSNQHRQQRPDPLPFSLPSLTGWRRQRRAWILTWLGGVRWRHLVVHHWVRRGLLVGQEALVSCCAQRVQRGRGVLVRLLGVLAVLLLHLLPGAELSVLQLLHVEVLALRQQLLPLLLQLGGETQREWVRTAN